METCVGEAAATPLYFRIHFELFSRFDLSLLLSDYIPHQNTYVFRTKWSLIFLLPAQNFCLKSQNHFCTGSYVLHYYDFSPALLKNMFAFVYKHTLLDCLVVCAVSPISCKCGGMLEHVFMGETFCLSFHSDWPFVWFGPFMPLEAVQFRFFQPVKILFRQAFIKLDQSNRPRRQLSCPW